VGVTWCAVGSACRPDDGWHPRGQIYFPTPDSEAPGAQALWIESQGERIKTWAVSRPGERALLYLGGNAEDVAGNVELFAEAFPDRSLYLVNYRGCGGSSGRPAEAGLVADAFAVFDQVRARHTNVTVMGRSVVRGVAVQVAAARPVERLALATAYDSLVNVARVPGRGTTGRARIKRHPKNRWIRIATRVFHPQAQSGSRSSTARSQRGHSWMFSRCGLNQRLPQAQRIS